MKSKVIPACLLAVAALTLHTGATTPLQTADSGAIERHRIFSPQMGDTLTIDVWMPASYRYGEEPRSVLYMHDGQNLFDKNTTWNGRSWEMDVVADSLENAKRIYAPLIVGIHSVAGTRIGDLCPQRALDYAACELDSMGKITAGELRGDRYAAFIVETLKPFIDANYNVSPAPEETYVMGSSMGGLMSLYLLSEYPEVFGGAGCLSTHWVGSNEDKGCFPEAMMEYMRERLPSPSGHRLYFDYGTGAYDENYAPWQPVADSIARKRGYEEGVNFMTVVAEGATHNEDAWRSRVHIPLQFLLTPACCKRNKRP